MKRTSETRITQLLKLMSDGKPRSSPQAAEEMRYHPSCVSGAMGCLHSRSQIHIVDWVRRRNAGGRMVAVYQFGDGDDVPMPTRSKEEYRKVQTAREIAERERLAKERERPIVPFRDPLVAAFYGEYRGTTA